MTALEELVAREYFERNGFFFKRLHEGGPEASKVQKPKAKTKEARLHPTYLVHRETGRIQNEPLGERFQLFSSDLGGLALAAVVFFGWGTPGLHLQVFQSGARYRSWIRNEVLPAYQASIEKALAQTSLPGTPVRVVLLPGLPAAEPYRQECIDLLKGAGVEALYSFRTLLESLVGQVHPGPDVASSAISELIRLLKVYELVPPPQMDLFDDF